MSDKKIFAIDPALSTFANTTRKKRAKDNSESKIKIKPSNKTNNNMSLKKRSIINMMRKHQETQYKEKFEQPGGNKSSIQQDVNAFQSDFDNAKEFFSNLQSNDSKKKAPSNHTLKQHTPIMPPIQLQPKITLPSLHDITGSITTTNTTPVTRINSNILPQPKYGCLKNGVLPTYRALMNQTRKNVPSTNITHHTNHTNHNNHSISNNSHNISNNKPIEHKERVGGTTNNIVEKPTMTELAKTAITSNQIQTKLMNAEKNKAQQRKQKRKKTIRRTYKIGRSKIMPKVSVLVSNKTIRNNITTKTHLIKQTPIHEIRNYLIRHGFIRVGAVTPNDVLRKMYESAMLICGEIQNHNPDNLLYNFLHAVDK